MNKPLINYYARLIKKGVYKLEDIPKDKIEDVKKVLDELHDIPLDPITQTPEKK